MKQATRGDVGTGFVVSPFVKVGYNSLSMIRFLRLGHWEGTTVRDIPFLRRVSRRTCVEAESGRPGIT